MTRSVRRVTVLACLILISACASLGGLGSVLQPPGFRAAEGRQAELRLIAPSRERPSGGALVRLWARVDNPNAVGITLTAVNGALSVDGRSAARVEFPLGLPLPAGRDTVIPMDIAIDPADLPGLVEATGRALLGAPVPYRLDGTMTVDAGLFQPSFGPLTLLEGDLRVRR